MKFSCTEQWVKIVFREKLLTGYSEIRHFYPTRNGLRLVSDEGLRILFNTYIIIHIITYNAVKTSFVFAYHLKGLGRNRTTITMIYQPSI